MLSIHYPRLAAHRLVTRAGKGQLMPTMNNYVKLGRHRATTRIMTLCALIIATSSVNTWADDPTVNFPVTTALLNQNESASTPVLDGMIVVWNDVRDGSDGDIYAQHMTRCGPADPTWPQNGVAMATGTVEQRGAVVIGDGFGGAFVAWINGLGLGRDIYAQHVLSTGIVDPTWPVNGVAVCTKPNAQTLPKITTDENHGAFLTWNDAQAGASRVFVQHLTPSGVDPTWTPDGIRACPAVEAGQVAPEICRDGAGGAILAWTDQRSGGTNLDVYAQRMSASGALLWSPAGEPVCTAAGRQVLNGAVPLGSIYITQYGDVQTCPIVPDGAGGCLVAWVDDRTFVSTGHDVYAQRLTSSGSVASGWTLNGVALCTAADNQTGPLVLPDGSGGGFATWIDFRSEIFVQHATALGVVDGPVDGLVLDADPGDPFAVGVYDDAGGAIFTWGDYDTTGTENVLAQHLKTYPSFDIDTGWPAYGALISGALEDQFFPVAVSDGSGGAIIHWLDARDFFTSTGVDIYSQRVLPSGNLPSGGSGPVASITGPPSGSIYPVNTPVTFTGSFTDAAGGTHTAEWTFDGMAPVPGTVNEGMGTVSANYTFTSPGVYTVALTVTGGCGSSVATTVGEFEALVVIYDPNGGFVTGGGWINSPAGAYTADPSLAGKANFGFVSKYQKNATIPGGDTEFQFKTAELNFKSTAYEWLVIGGAKAQYKGTGTINGSGTYKFMLTAIDGAFQSNGPDKFRIKITDPGGGLVYDNQLNAPDSDDPTTLLGGGSIVIHKNGNGPAGNDQAMGPLVYALAPGLTNPLRSGAAISYSLAERSRVHIDLYDVSGRKRGALVDDEQPAGTYSIPLSLQGHLPGGVYYLRMVADSIEGPTKFRDTRSIVVTH